MRCNSATRICFQGSPSSVSTQTLNAETHASPSASLPMLREKAFALELATSAMWIATSIALVGRLVSRRHTESIRSLMRRLAEAYLSSLLPDESKELSALLLSAKECKRHQMAYPFAVTSLESHGKDWWKEIEWYWCLCSPMTLTYYDTWNDLQSDSQIEIHRVHVTNWIWSVLLHRDFMKFCT